MESLLGGSPPLLSREQGEMNGNEENGVLHNFSQISRDSLKRGEGVMEGSLDMKLATLSLGTADCSCFELRMGKLHSFHI